MAIRESLQRFVALISATIISSTPLVLSQPSDSILPLKQIFSKPYIAGTRPADPTLSPDGKILLFRWDSTARGIYRYWLTRSDGTGLHQIADTLAGNIEWSPDSKTIACTRKGDIFLTDSSFSSFHRLTKTDADEHSLRFSPDGKYLVYSVESKVLALALHEGGVFDVAKPAWKEGSVSMIDLSPDGKKILFVESSNDSLPEFVVPRYTGKDVSTRSFRGGVGRTRIGFSRLADTGAVAWIRLPGEERFFPGDMAFSPDGRNVFVERFSANRKLREIFVADTDSGKATKIYEEKDKAWIEGGLCTTRWMPDGKHIITTSEKDGWNHLYIMEPDGKHLKKLTDGEWEIHWFDVLPSGREIVFLANRDDLHQWQIYSLDIASKAIRSEERRVGKECRL